MAKNLQAGLRQSIKASSKASVTGAGIFSLAPLDLRFALQKTLDPRITFTRASTGTYVGSDGLVKTAATNEARFDHNPTTGESLGLLVEEARTNLALRSEEFSDATWLKAGGTTCSANVVTAPDGTTTADKLVEFNGNVSQSFEQVNTLVLGTAYSISIYAKAAERIQCRLAGRISSNWVLFPSGRFDLSTGTVLNSSGDKTATISAVGDGWYRCTIYGTSAVGTSAGMIVSPLLTGGTVSSYVGDGTSGIYLWGAQLEAGAFPTSYIPTTTATATRAADVASITGTAFSSWYRQDEGTMFANYAERAFSSTHQIASISNNTTAERISLALNASNVLDVAVVSGGTDTFTGNTPTLTAQEYRIGFGYKADNSGVSANGSAITVDGAVTLPTVSQLDVGARAGSAQILNSTIKRLTYWPIRLPNATLSGGAAPEATEYILTEDSDALLYEDGTFIYQE